MRITGFALIAILLLQGSSFGTAKVEIRDEMDRISYSVGYQMGRDFKMQKIEIRPEIFLKGIQDALDSSPPLINYEEMREILVNLKTRVVAIQKQQAEEKAEQTLKEGQAFLKENGKKDGIDTLPSGLQYEILTEGEGNSPKATDTVTVHYHGTLIDGTEFDSSYSRNKPSTFALDRVIQGWTEGLQLMKPGAKYRFFIPSDLAYGNRGAGSMIGPNSTLVFEVQLLSVQRK